MPQPLSPTQPRLPCPPTLPAASPKREKRFTVELGEARAVPGVPPSTADLGRPGGPLSATSASKASPPSAPPALVRILADEKAVDRGLARALGGGPMSPQALLALQVTVIRYAQELEVASRIVEKVTSTVKQVLQSQV